MTESVKQETTTVTTTTTKKNASIITCSVPVIYTTGNISQRKWMKPIRDQNYLHRKDTFVCSLIELHYCSPVDLTPLTNKRHLVHFKLISSNDSNSSFSRKINDQLGFFFLPLFVSKFELSNAISTVLIKIWSEIWFDLFQNWLLTSLHVIVNQIKWNHHR